MGLGLDKYKHTIMICKDITTRLIMHRTQLRKAVLYLNFASHSVKKGYYSQKRLLHQITLNLAATHHTVIEHVE